MNFQELYSKIRAIDENVAPVEECGEMAPMASMMGGAHPVPPQQDNISMNVSMNAQGTGGLRDLMAVLQAIEQGTDGTDGGAVVVHGTDDAGGSDDFASALDSLVGGEEEVSLGDKMADENMDMVPNDPDMNTGAPAPQPSTDDQSTDDQMASEEYQNEPNETYQSADYMTKTLAGGSDEPQHMKKHGYGNSDNPLGMKESLINELSNLYQEVKFREAKEKKMSRAAKGYEKYGKKGMQALAKAGKEGKDLDKVRDKYNKYDEGFEQMPQNTAPAPTMPTMPAQKPANPNDYSAIKSSPEWKQLQANLEAAINAGDPDSPALAKAMQDIKAFTAKMGIKR
jgi:hypothetical protein